MIRSLLLPLMATAAVAALGCGSAGVVTAEVPEYQPRNETKCELRKSQDRPLIIEWSPNDRAALESRLRQGVVPVRYVGCDMEVLSRCTSDVPYAYRGVTRESERVQIEDVDTLYANLPFGAVALEGQLERSGRLDVAMTIAGRYEAERSTIAANELQGGACAAATHVVVAVNVGAFSLSAGGAASAGAGVDVLGRGAAVEGRSRRTELKRAGDPVSCEVASRDDDEPPEGCGALLRLEVVPIGEARLPEPVCPEGSAWNGTQCVRTRVLTKLQCPSGTRLKGRACEPLVRRQCPDGMRYEEGHGCLAKGLPTPEEDDDDGPGVGGIILGLTVASGTVAALAIALVVASNADDDPEVLPPPEGRDGGLDNAPLRWEF